MSIQTVYLSVYYAYLTEFLHIAQIFKDPSIVYSISVLFSIIYFENIFISFCLIFLFGHSTLHATFYRLPYLLLTEALKHNYF